MTALPHVLITGGASGIGLESARLLAAQGWLPILLDRDRDRSALADAGAEPGMPSARTPYDDIAGELQVKSAFRVCSRLIASRVAASNAPWSGAGAAANETATDPGYINGQIIAVDGGFAGAGMLG
ncbi:MULTISPECIES: SDR family NAD(P)-dependent oxidoreductase [Pseudomonas]|uniref:SDR family NAD(P)-dependent oxidoreductase n=1 Tax=Pseudomonas TaxID=286 RepID=UPI002579AD0D|nr:MULTISPECIES: SDR family NAD(P)-dependent oxidoreductase [Pseudomonas]